MKTAGFVCICYCVYTNIIVVGEVFTLGYLTGSQRRSGNFEYAKPGKRNKMNFSLAFFFWFYFESIVLGILFAFVIVH